VGVPGAGAEDASAGGDAAAAGAPDKPASAKDMGDVRRFLNRLLGMPVAQQNLLFRCVNVLLANAD
jgi:hypothetical protein